MGQKGIEVPIPTLLEDRAGPRHDDSYRHSGLPRVFQLQHIEQAGVLRRRRAPDDQDSTLRTQPQDPQRERRHDDGHSDGDRHPLESCRHDNTPESRVTLMNSIT